MPVNGILLSITRPMLLVIVIWKLLITLGVTAGAEEQSDRLVSLRRLLETELTVANDNNTYPNTTLNVRLHAKFMSFPAVQHHYRTPLRPVCPSRLCLLIVKQLPNTFKFCNSLGKILLQVVIFSRCNHQKTCPAARLEEKVPLTASIFGRWVCLDQRAASLGGPRLSGPQTWCAPRTARCQASRKATTLDVSSPIHCG